MTYQSPRIYLYKITFEEVPYYYYGVHKEKKFGEYYMGSPITHKWCWDFYTPKKQVLEIFEFSDMGWLEAQEVEKRLIKPFYTDDKWCLNENVGGRISLQIAREVGLKHKENGTALFSLTEEEKRELGRKNGKKIYDERIGIHSPTYGKTSENSRKRGQKTYERGTGIFSLTPEERKQASSKGGKKSYENRIGFFSLTPEERKQASSKGGKKVFEQKLGMFSFTPEERSEVGRKSAQKVNSQKWECCETGYTSTAAGVVRFQRGRGIDTSKNNRRRIA